MSKRLAAISDGAVAIRFEEHDLRAHLGAAYDRYADDVPGLVPGAHALVRRNGRKNERAPSWN